ncbi:MAG: AAA family ATPase [Tumebacillaceae bacterium]
MSDQTIRNLRIENFQSHELTEMAFDEGLNVIVGASDQGKSAVIRALRWLLFNEPRGSDFIRVGASQCRVSIELADGSRVTRERTASKNRYIVVKSDGTEQVYEGFGNTVPKEVSDVTGVAKVMLDEDHETTLHLGTQLEPPFMLSEPGSIKAKAIGRLNGVHIIDAASRDTHRDLTRLVSDERTQYTLLEEVEEELGHFSDVLYMESIMPTLESMQAQIKDMITRRERLQMLLKQYTEVSANLQTVNLVLEQTEQIDRAALQAEQAVALRSKAVRLEQARTKLEQVANGIAQTDRVLQGTSGLERAGESLGRSEQLLGTYNRLARLATGRDQVQAVKVRVDAVLDKTSHLEEVAGHVQRIERAKDRYGRLLHLRDKHGETLRVMSNVDRVLHQTAHLSEAGGMLEELVQKRNQALLLQEMQGKKQEVERHLQNNLRLLQALGQTEEAGEALQRLSYLTQRQEKLELLNKQLLDVEVRLQKGDVYLRDNDAEIKRLMEEYSRELKMSGTCPVCFAPIDDHTTERLLEEFRGGTER